MDRLEEFVSGCLAKEPVLGSGVFLAAGARLVGEVTLGDHASVWFNAVVRGDIHPVVVGHHTNLQDNAVLHVGYDLPCRVGNYVTVGHSAVVHGCTVGDEVLIGMGATLLDGAVIGEQCMIGANALVTQNARIPPGSLVVGAPARVVRGLTTEERAQLKAQAEDYVRLAACYLARQAPPRPAT